MTIRRLICSVFPGIDLLGRGFEAEGYCVVRGPDLLWGSNVRSFTPPWGAFEGLIGGSPCQDFSRIRRAEPTGEGLAMMRQFRRIVEEGFPEWFLLENVPGSPDFAVESYTMQRIHLDARECGGLQRRMRKFFFGSRDGAGIVIARCDTRPAKSQRTCLASEGTRANRRAWPDFCELQGLPRDFTLPGLSRKASYRAVGNGVPVYMARVLAAAIKVRCDTVKVKVCVCECGRPVTARASSATAACRKRMERRRRDLAIAAPARPVTSGELWGDKGALTDVNISSQMED